MPTSVTMPALGESVTEGTVTRWLKQEGEQVEADEPLLEVSTDKVDTEIPSPAAGVLTKILVAEDETVAVGAELAVIGGGSGGGGGGEGTSVTMPALGESVTEGTVTRWLKAVGDEITADEPLLEVSTDKVDTEIPAPVSGTLLEITVNEDETVDVGAQLAVIGSGAAGGSAAPAPAPEAPKQETATQEAPKQEAPAPAVAPQAPAEQQASDGGGSYVTPLVRRLAADRGVDLGSVSGTGVGGR